MSEDYLDRSDDQGGRRGRRRRRRRRGRGGQDGAPREGEERGERPERGRDRERGDRDRGDRGDRDRGDRGGGRQEGGGEGFEDVEGLLVVTKEGFGFLRQRKNSYLAGSGDVFVPSGLIQRYRLRAGQYVAGALGRGRRGKRKRPLERVDTVDDLSPAEASGRPRHQHLTSIDPTRRIFFETKDGDQTLRVIDLVTPMGFGQRSLVVAPPRTGKTVILHKIANAIGENHPEAKVIVLLVDERPEEVTDFRRTCKNAEVVASSLDMDASAHVAIVEVILQRVRRLAEAGHDVVVLTDSLTRMARAFNTERGRSGRTLTGGLDSTAMQKPREFFGAARAFEEGGSITNIATVLVDTGSKMDQVIFEEFKGTGNCELVLNRDLADLRIFPSINVKDSGTRKEEKLRDPQEYQLITLLRRGLLRFSNQRIMEQLLKQTRQTRSNAELLLMLNKQMA
ncbi:MAG: transcription termination factor Rho [Planctomycetota bacterium]